MIIPEENTLAHYGILRRSGRYPWGSGGNVESRSRSFLGMVADLRRKGLKDTEIARAFSTPDQKFTTTDLRAAASIAKNAAKQADIAQAERLRARGWSTSAIARRMNKNESSVRALLAPGVKDRADVLAATSTTLKAEVDKHGFIDVGVGIERHMGISQTKLATAVARLKEEGYELHRVKITQLGTGQQTEVKVLTRPGTTQKDTWMNRDKIRLPIAHSTDGGRTYTGFLPPVSISSRRVQVKYAEDGGAEADGVLYIRPGVKDVSIGKARYAQVRVMVDGTHYLKGMAIYKDDLPPGVDIQFNTNKRNTGKKTDAMKRISDDPDLPFGSIVRQLKTTGRDGKVKVTSSMNIVGTKEGSGEEGSWETWSRSLSSQFLSKQSPSLAKEQLAMTQERRQREFDEIMSLTNPAVKRKLLETFADDADSAAVHLKAAALPRQRNSVILPIGSMKPTEVYAPNFRDGERVALVRHPHGGTFEIPELTVNNRNPEAKKLLGSAQDAIGIHHSVAQRLSGADFDGDTVLVIPNGSGKVKSTPALEGLKGFDPISAFPGYPGMPKMSGSTKQTEMGNISNLITDMTIQGAPHSEIARAVRHSMVVIDAEKHNLNYKQSAIDNGIAQLKAKYQGKSNAGASTLISRAKSEARPLDRKPRSAAKGGPIDKATGKKVYELTGATRTVRTKGGKVEVVPKTIKSTKLAETDDAHTLSSGTKIEQIYADHSNSLKRLAERARREALATRSTTYSPSAKATYSAEVASLNAKLNIALRNAPLERQAQIVGNANVAQKLRANPHLEKSQVKKIKAQELDRARSRVGAGKERIHITPREWEAIQAGAITHSKLTQILSNTDVDQVRALATPRRNVLMTTAKTQRAKSMLAAGYTQAEVADALGVSLTTLKTSLA